MWFSTGLLVGCLMACAASSIGGICEDTESLTVNLHNKWFHRRLLGFLCFQLPSKCCHAGRHLLNQETLKMCTDSTAKNVASGWEFTRTSPILYCYFNASHLINIEGQIDVEKSNEHFAINYPVNAMDLAACGNKSKWVPGSKLSNLSLAVSGKTLLGYGEINQALLHWLMCIERSLMDCPELKITNDKCENLQHFIDSCLTTKVRIDYFLSLHPYLITV